MDYYWLCIPLAKVHAVPRMWMWPRSPKLWPTWPGHLVVAHAPTSLPWRPPAGMQNATLWTPTAWWDASPVAPTTASTWKLSAARDTSQSANTVDSLPVSTHIQNIYICPVQGGKKHAHSLYPLTNQNEVSQQWWNEIEKWKMMKYMFICTKFRVWGKESRGAWLHFNMTASHILPLTLLQVPAVRQGSSSTAGPTTPSGCTGALWAVRCTTTQWSCTGREPTTPASQLPAAPTVTSRRKHVGTSTQCWQHLWDRTGSKSASVSPGHTQVGHTVDGLISQFFICFRSLCFWILSFFSQFPAQEVMLAWVSIHLNVNFTLGFGSDTGSLGS